MDPTPEEKLRSEFLLHEYDALQQKIKHSVDDLARTETIIPVAIAAIYTWLLRDGNHFVDTSPWVLLLPSGLAVLGRMRQNARYGYLTLVEGYVRQLEEQVYGPNGQAGPFRGYERYYQATNEGTHGRLRTAFWTILIVGSIAFAAWKMVFG